MLRDDNDADVPMFLRIEPETTIPKLRYSGEWQTASILWPSESSTNAP